MLKAGRKERKPEREGWGIERKEKEGLSLQKVWSDAGKGEMGKGCIARHTRTHTHIQHVQMGGV